jgi:phosphoribosylformylglycinamidine (FGAM) synthase-like enzyme
MLLGAEFVMLAQTWSEHCSLKTFKAIVDYREADRIGNTLNGKPSMGC